MRNSNIFDSACSKIASEYSGNPPNKLTYKPLSETLENPWKRAPIIIKGPYSAYQHKIIGFAFPPGRQIVCHPVSPINGSMDMQKKFASPLKIRTISAGK
jgi:hypothetical protein